MMIRNKNKKFCILICIIFCLCCICFVCFSNQGINGYSQSFEMKDAESGYFWLSKNEIIIPNERDFFDYYNIENNVSKKIEPIPSEKRVEIKARMPEIEKQVLTSLSTSINSFRKSNQPDKYPLFVPKGERVVEKAESSNYCIWLTENKITPIMRWANSNFKIDQNVWITRKLWIGTKKDDKAELLASIKIRENENGLHEPREVKWSNNCSQYSFYYNGMIYVFPNKFR